MKTFLTTKQIHILVKPILFVTLLATNVFAKAQANQELIFSNPTLYSGTAGADNAVYRFPLVTPNLDAMVKINGRSSSIVKLSSIDVTNTGFSKAFQPRIEYDYGNNYASGSYWMEFKITFVTKNTNIPATITTFKATALDIDGDDDELHEWDSFYGLTSYTLETNSNLNVSNLMEWLFGLLMPVGKTFDGVEDNYSGIDTTQTNVMTTVKYDNVNSMRFRLGCTTTGTDDEPERLYSMWFKNFTYNAPVTLPIKLNSFTATLNNSNDKADLKWTSSSEINASHFIVQKSFDGINFTDAGIVFANGNATGNSNYSFPDNLSGKISPIVYYRLCLVDIDGQVQYSETRMIRLGKETDNKITILTYPNPATNEIRVTIPSTWQNKKVSYELVNVNGQTASRTQSASANQTETINLRQMAPGFYIVKVSCGTETAQQRIVKQ